MPIINITILQCPSTHLLGPASARKLEERQKAKREDSILNNSPNCALYLLNFLRFSFDEQDLPSAGVSAHNPTLDSQLGQVAHQLLISLVILGRLLQIYEELIPVVSTNYSLACLWLYLNIKKNPLALFVKVAQTLTKALAQSPLPQHFNYQFLSYNLYPFLYNNAHASHNHSFNSMRFTKFPHAKCYQFFTDI